MRQRNIRNKASSLGNGTTCIYASDEAVTAVCVRCKFRIL